MKYYNENNKYGFTLVEVLITLGIISVLVAILIPSLMEKVQDWQFKQAAKKAFSVSAQAVEQMRMDDGGTLNNYVATSLSFKPVFIKYFKVIKDCGWSSCVADSSASKIYTELDGTPAYTNFMDDGQFVTADGMFFGIENYSGGGTPIMITVDVNGYEKKPNVFGKDTFMFQIVNNNLVPMGGNNTHFNAPSYCKRTGSYYYQGLGCMYYVMRGINY